MSESQHHLNSMPPPQNPPNSMPPPQNSPSSLPPPQLLPSTFPQSVSVSSQFAQNSNSHIDSFPSHQNLTNQNSFAETSTSASTAQVSSSTSSQTPHNSFGLSQQSTNLPPHSQIEHLSPTTSLPQNKNSSISNTIVAPPQLSNATRPHLNNSFPSLRPPRPHIPAPDVWVETNAPDGKVYYYHAQSRQTQWTKPQNTTVISQEEFKTMVLTVSSSLPLPSVGGSNAPPNLPGSIPRPNAAFNINNMPPPSSHQLNLPRLPPQPLTGQYGLANPIGGAPPMGSFNNQHHNAGTHPQLVPPPHNPMMTFAPNGNPRPGMPPSNYNMFPVGLPPNNDLPNQHGTFAPPAVPPHNRAPVPSGPPPPALAGQLPYNTAVQSAPKPPLAGTEWAENVSSTDGKKYWYNIRTMQTTWTKPKEVEDAEKAQKEAEELARIEEERKKKEEADRLEKEAKEAEAKARAKPVASHPIPHSPWCIVFTGDNKVFYFNPSSKLSVWHRPEDLMHNGDVDSILSNPPHKVNAKLASLDSSSTSVQSTKTDQLQQQQSTGAKPTSSEVDGAEASIDDESPAAKKKKTEDAAQKLDEARIANLRSSIPYETRQQQFMEMLAERNVSAFSTWDKELPKIVFDHRYSLLTAKERKNVFDVFTRNKAEEERKERSNKIKEKREQFKSLLEESDISSRMTFTEWLARGWSKDPRFKAIEKNRERETMFDEYVNQLRVKEQQTTKSKLSSMKEQFFSLLDEQSYLDESARWSKLRTLIEDDSRYKAVPSNSLREQWFNEYIDEEKKKMDPEEVREAEKKKRVEESMRARQQAVAEEREENNRVISEQRLQHRREESVQRFKALLADIIKENEISWKAARRLMKKDRRWNGSGLDDEESAGCLTREDKEELFNEHIEELSEKRKVQFREMLDQCESITFTTTWREARKKVKDDARYEKFSSSDRKREKEFETWKETAYMRAKHNFKELLKETRLITHKSFSLVKQSEQHMHDIEETLKKDKRYLILNSINQERRKMIVNYLEDFAKRGPPPPPTASDPSRRLLPPLSSSSAMSDAN